MHNKITGESLIGVVDIMGHGAEAATVANMTTKFFQKYENIGGKKFQLAEIAENLNTTFNYYGSKIWATVQLIVFDRDCANYSILNAGHVFPLVSNGDERFKTIKMRSSPIGSKEECQYSIKQLELTRGEKIFLYSDGVSSKKTKVTKCMAKRRCRRIWNQ